MTQTRSHNAEDAELHRMELCWQRDLLAQALEGPQLRSDARRLLAGMFSDVERQLQRVTGIAEPRPAVRSNTTSVNPPAGIARRSAKAAGAAKAA